jgi:hypothetical protein
MDREFILKAIEKSGLQRTRSCCGVDDKFCNTDEWRGNLEGFAQAIVDLFWERIPRHTSDDR